MMMDGLVGRPGRRVVMSLIDGGFALCGDVGYMLDLMRTTDLFRFHRISAR